MRRKTLAVGLVLLAPLVLLAEPVFEKLDLFQSDEAGYSMYHIPGLVVTAKGTVLAFCEARRDRGSDWAPIDILLRRSTDEGKTWSKPEKITKFNGTPFKNPTALERKLTKPDAGLTFNNPVAIASRDGTVHFVYCVEYFRAFYMQSKDDGATWSAPVEITSAFEKYRKQYDWVVIATGPGHSIELTNGRLVVPAWLSTGTAGNAHRPSIIATIYSDDRGKTWSGGEIAVPCTEQYVNPSESVVTQLADGRVMLNARTESKPHRRLVTISKDGATGWSTPKFDDGLVEPICMASMIRLSTKADSDKNRILFANPDNLARADGKEAPGKNRDRKNISVRLSYDEGKTWAVKKVLEPEWSGYSDLAVTKSRTILCLYGAGNKTSYAGSKLTLARFNLEWLTGDKDSLPVR